MLLLGVITNCLRIKLSHKNRQNVAKIAKLAKSRKNGKKPIPHQRHVAKPGKAGQSIVNSIPYRIEQEEKIQ